jgi:ubiquinone/menaquinone biosynthesis C-methylase UbiE
MGDGRQDQETLAESSRGGKNGSNDDARVTKTAGLFDALAADYDAVGVEFFGPIARGLVAELHARPGEVVADLGCGKGAVTLPLASAVGTSGRVDALDISPAMVTATETAAREQGIGNVIAAVGDVRSPDLTAGRYDVVASSLVLFFLPNPGGSLTRWVQLLRPGGRLGLATFGPADENWRNVDEVFTPFLPPDMLDARVSGRKGPFASDGGMGELARQAGLAEVRTATLDLAVRFADVSAWRAWSSPW